MTFLSIVLALVLEQFKPLRSANPLYQAYLRYLGYIVRNFNAGRHGDGVLAWMLALLPVVMAAAAALLLVHLGGGLVKLAINVGVLYLAMGFRHFSNYYNDILLALRAGDLPRAREVLGAWRGRPAQEMNANEVARVAIELGLVFSHRHVFGVIAWFAVLGPGGALAYRVAAVLAERWGAHHGAESEAVPSGQFGQFAMRAFEFMDWVPARLTALGFGAAGDFMGAWWSWRDQAPHWHEHHRGIVLASAAGALGVRLGGFVHREGGVEDRPALGDGEEAGVDDMEPAAMLVWRALVLWLFLIMIVTLASAVH